MPGSVSGSGSGVDDFSGDFSCYQIVIKKLCLGCTTLVCCASFNPREQPTTIRRKQ